MSQALRVAMVTPRFRPDVGGIETHVYETSRRLAAAGVDVTVVTTDRTGALPSREVCEGVAIRRVRAWPRRADYYVAPAVMRELMRSYDLVHCQGYHTFVAPAAMLACIRRATPFVVSFHSGGHSSRMRSALRPLQIRALRPLLARARRLIAVSRFEAELFHRRLRLPRDRFAVIPNGADAIATSAPDADGGTLILSIGRLERYKGHHRAIAALPTIIRSRPDARLVVVGDGPSRDRLAEDARRAGVADRVDIRAYPGDARRDFLALLSAASLVVLLSEYEAHPVAVMEAAALGRPTLVSDASGLRELRESGYARGVPADASPQEVGRAAIDVIESGWTPRQAGLLTWDDCAARLLAVYREALG